MKEPAITPKVDENVLRVLELISSQPGLTQRRMAEEAGVSLGLINVILRRLVKTGYIKINQLTGRKVSYLLTPKGLSEKTKRSYLYLCRTIHIFRRQQTRCESIMDQLLRSGYKSFAILGDNEISSLVELAIREHSQKIQSRRISMTETTRPGELILDCRLDESLDGSLGTAALARLLRSSDPADVQIRPKRISMAHTLMNTQLAGE